MNETDRKFLLRAIEVAASARRHGNHPFGAILVDTDGNILLEAENTVVTERDATGHAETNLVRLASKKYDPGFLSTCTLYTSTEPCCMCSGAIYWANIGRMVYALSEVTLDTVVRDDPNNKTLALPSREVFARGKFRVQVDGPLELEEALKVHEGFWQPTVK